MSAYRFVHTADVHLDSPLRSLALRDPRLAEFVSFGFPTFKQSRRLSFTFR